jgi:hypothetical protein
MRMTEIPSKPPRRPMKLEGARDDKLLDRLLNDGLSALQREDDEIGTLLRKSHPKASLEGFNAGVLYWLYETTLAYLVLKAWLQSTPAHWEHQYPPYMQGTRGSKLKADLVVNRAGSPVWAFEAKWFPNTQAKMMGYLEHDVARLLRWVELERRFLLIFWSGAAPSFKEDWARRRDAVSQRCGRIAQVEPCWIDAFPADRHDLIPSREGYFAMGAFHIRTR